MPTEPIRVSVPTVAKPPGPRSQPTRVVLALLALWLCAPPVLCSDFDMDEKKDSLFWSLGTSGIWSSSSDAGLAAQYTAVVSDAKEAQARAANSLAYANSFTCAAAAPYQAAAQAAVDQANAEVAKLDKSLTIADAEKVRDAAELAAAEATRNGYLAAQACGAPVPPDVIYTSPFDGIASPYPTWDNTFWDISSP